MRGRYLDLLAHNPDFRRLYLARLVSFGGDWFLLVPMLALVHELSASPLLTAAVLTANTLPAFLFSPLGGILADRLDRKKIIIWSSLAAAAASATLLTVNTSFVRERGIGVPLVLAVMSVLAGLSALITPASSASLGQVVSEDQLGDGSFLLESTWGTMAAVGAALGGLVSANLGRERAVAIDSISFLLAAVLMLRIKTKLAAPHAAAHDAGRIGPALDYLRKRPAVAALMTSKAGFAIFGAGAVALLPTLALDDFGAGDDGVGWLLGMRGVGVLLGPFLIRRLVRNENRAVLGAIGFCMALWGISYFGIAFAPSLLVAALCVLVGHAGAGSQWSFSSFGLQLYTAPELKGRIFGLDFAAVTLTSTASQLLFGWLAIDNSINTIFLWLAATAVGFGIVWRRVTLRYWAVP
jgi:MFS family permease